MVRHKISANCCYRKQVASIPHSSVFTYKMPQTGLEDNESGVHLTAKEMAPRTWRVPCGSAGRGNGGGRGGIPRPESWEDTLSALPTLLVRKPLRGTFFHSVILPGLAMCMHGVVETCDHISGFIAEV